jgi:hypothetical protein
MWNKLVRNKKIVHLYKPPKTDQETIFDLRESCYNNLERIAVEFNFGILVYWAVIMARIVVTVPQTITQWYILVFLRAFMT